MSVQSVHSRWRTVRFEDIAENVAVRVEPAEVQTDVYVGLEHLDPETLHLRKWGHPSDVTGQKLAFKKGDVISAAVVPTNASSRWLSLTASARLMRW